MKMFGLTLLVVSMLYGSAFAATPNLINFQGRLTTPSGTPVPNSTYSVNFTLYDAPTGGVPQWGETQTVTTTGGLFTVQLGSVILFGSDVFGDSTLWLGITVGADPELTPRTRLISVPYARQATIGGGWYDDISGVRLNDNTDNVGIGTPTPANRLHVVDATGGIFPVRIEGSSTIATVTELNNSTSAATWEYGVVGSDGAFFGSVAPGSSYLNKQGTAFPSMVLTPDRRIGMGTGSPMAQLDVQSPFDTIVGYFRAQNGSQSTSAVYGHYAGAGTWDAVGVRGLSAPAAGYGYGGYFEGGYMGVKASVDHTGNLDATGVFGEATSGGSSHRFGVRGSAAGQFSGGNGYGVYGSATGSDFNYGVYGTVTGGHPWSAAVRGTSSAGPAGVSIGGEFSAVGPAGICYGIRAEASGGTVWSRAGQFEGDVVVNGTLVKTAGSFRIDHPLDPEHKYLQHSFVESADMKNIYDGMVTLNASGEATVTLPDWFGALNENFRYQLTCVGGYAPIYISSKLADSKFSIAGGTPGLEVSWQLTGIRKDVYAKAHPIEVEVEKRAHERGRYQYPELYGKSEEFGIESALRKGPPDVGAALSRPLKPGLPREESQGQ